MRKITPEFALKWIILGLLAYMPFHLFLSRWLSLYTGGLSAWELGKDFLTVFSLILAVCILVRERFYKSKYIAFLFFSGAAYFLLHALFLVFQKGPELEIIVAATLFNGRPIAYVLIGMVAGKTYGRDLFSTALKVVLIASTVTCVFAIAQYVLPKDLMEHFGYTIERGAKPAFFIDDKPDLPRVMSTIRDPNSYGAYLILPVTFLWLKLQDRQKKNRTGKLAVLFSLHLLALMLTFSRGAWIGAGLSLLMVTLYWHRRSMSHLLRQYAIPFVVILIVLSGVGYITRDNYVVQNVILHSDEQTVEDDPNEIRLRVQREATRAIMHEPLGHGPGTAGLISIQTDEVFLTENYLLQIGYEVGVLGLLIFILILGVLLIWLLKTVATIPSLALAGGFAAYILISLLIHLWSNEAVAMQWWGLTGLWLGASLYKSRTRKVTK